MRSYPKIRRLNLWLTLLVLFSMVLAGCGGGDEAPAAPAATEAPAAAPAATEAPAATAAPVLGAAPAATRQPASGGPAVQATPAESADTYVDPDGNFNVMNWGGTVETTADRTTFQRDNDLVLVSYEEKDTPLLPVMVMGEAESWVNWAFQPESIEFGEAMMGQFGSRTGYWVPFTTPPNADGYQQGQVFLLRVGNRNWGILLYGVDTAAEGEWEALLNSFKPAGWDEAEAQPAPLQAPEGEPEVSDDGDVFSGLDPATYGFSFENYTRDEGYTNLTPVEMQRMFGDVVCASQADGECILTPAANEWMEATNDSMGFGHCMGLAVLSSLMYYGQADANNFGAPVANELAIYDNEPLQREIAYWFATQYTQPASYMNIWDTPSEILKVLDEGLKSRTESYTIGIYKRGGGGGHAITPVGIDYQEDGTAEVQVYDNNYPGEIRILTVDPQAETWQYNAAINPDVEPVIYEGDETTQSFSLTGISLSLVPQECTFCDQDAATGFAANRASFAPASGKAAGLAAPQRAGLTQGRPKAQYYEIWMKSTADLVVVDDQGRRTGFAGGQFVNEIPGASQRPVKYQVDLFNNNNLPVLLVPVGPNYRIIADGAGVAEATEASVSVIGPGYYFAMDNLLISPSDQDEINVISENGTYHLTYTSDEDEIPSAWIGLEGATKDNDFRVKAAEPGVATQFDITVDTQTGKFAVKTAAGSGPAIYDIAIVQINDAGLATFTAEGVQVDENSTDYLDYGGWEGEGDTMEIEVDEGNDGSIDADSEMDDSDSSDDAYGDDGDGDGGEDGGGEDGGGEGGGEGAPAAALPPAIAALQAAVRFFSI